jgi:hypothetical protein
VKLSFIGGKYAYYVTAAGATAHGRLRRNGGALPRCAALLGCAIPGTLSVLPAVSASLVGRRVERPLQHQG